MTTSISSLATARPLHSEDRAPSSGLYSWLGGLLQITDSAYPTGVFAHSNGLEGLVQLEMVCTPEDLERHVTETVFAGLEGADFPIIRFSHEAALVGDGERLGELDELAAALRTPEELRLASSRSGRQRLDLMERVMHFERRDPAGWKELTAALSHTQLPVVSGLESALLEVPLDAALQAYGFATLSGTLSAALKILRLGQTVIQEILYRQTANLPALIDRSMLVTPDRVGTFTPLLDIASARHKRAHSRLFLS